TPTADHDPTDPATAGPPALAPNPSPRRRRSRPCRDRRGSSSAAVTPGTKCTRHGSAANARVAPHVQAAGGCLQNWRGFDTGTVGSAISTRSVKGFRERDDTSLEPVGLVSAAVLIDVP